MNSKNYKFIITDKAKNDLDEIVRYIAIELAAPSAASSFLDQFLEAVQLICSFPESCSFIDNDFVPANTIRHKVIGNYVLYYLPNHQQRTCTVIRILYGKRNLKEILTDQDSE